MLYQVMAPYCLAADLSIQFQREMLGRWLDAWSRVLEGAVGGERADRASVASPGMSGDSSRQAGTEETGPATNDAEEEAILRRAYFMWLDEGRPDGQHLRHYFEAARQIRG